MNGFESKKSLQETYAELPEMLAELIPPANMAYLESTNKMHCNLEEMGGSKFLEISNILEVLQRDSERIGDAVGRRIDDRDALLTAGSAKEAFLPAIKQEGDPEGLPEALYYKVDGVKGKLSIEQLANLDPDTKVLVRREKSVKDDSGREKVPCSYTVIKGTFEELPDTDFATVIVGREGGEAGKNELWTIHPGMPIRAAQGDFLPGSETLPGPQEGIKQRVMITTVAELLATEKMTPASYVKISPGNFDEAIAGFEA